MSVVAATVLQWIGKRVVEALKASLVERTVLNTVARSPTAAFSYSLSYGRMDPHLSYQ